jgi:hypothetical protein
MSAPYVPVFNPSSVLTEPPSSVSYEELAANLDGLSFSWLYARFLQYLRDSNLLNSSITGRSLDAGALAKRLDLNHSIDNVYFDNQTWNSHLHVQDPFFMNMTLPMMVHVLGLDKGLNNTDSLGGPNSSDAMLLPIPELIYCGVKWKGDPAVNGASNITTPQVCPDSCFYLCGSGKWLTMSSSLMAGCET